MIDHPTPRGFHCFGSAVEDGLDWGSFARVTLAAFPFVLIAGLAFGRRSTYA